MILFGSMYMCVSRRQSEDGEEAGEGNDVIVFIYRAAWIGKGGKREVGRCHGQGQLSFTRIKKEGDEYMSA